MTADQALDFLLGYFYRASEQKVAIHHWSIAGKLEMVIRSAFVRARASQILFDKNMVIALAEAWLISNPNANPLE